MKIPSKEARVVMLLAAGLAVVVAARVLCVFGCGCDVSETAKEEPEVPFVASVVPAKPDAFPCLTENRRGRPLVLISNVLADGFGRQREEILRALASFGDDITVFEMPAVQDARTEKIAGALMTAYLSNERVYHRMMHRLASGEVRAETDVILDETAFRTGLVNFDAVAARSADEILSLIVASGTLTRSHGQGRAACTLVADTAHAFSSRHVDAEEVVRFAEAELGVRSSWEIPARAPLSAHVHAAVLSVEEACIDLGEVAPGTESVVRVPVANAGTRPLHLDRVICPHGVLLASLPRKAIRPGEEAIVGLRVIAPPTPGRFERLVEFLSDDPMPLPPLSIVASVSGNASSLGAVSTLP